MKKIIFLFLFLCSLAGAEDKELFFPLEKSSIKILPQRFEFELIDADNIRIGDAKMNMSLIDLQMSPAGANQWRLRFQWPSSLVKAGDVVIKDNVGKALWSFKASDVRSGRDGNDVAAIFEKDISAPRSEEILKRTPFFKVCIHRQEPTTRIFLCSKEHYFSSKGNVRPRKRNESETLIEINGKAVSSQGLIFLNSPNEFLQLRSEFSNGNSLEIETRMKSVDFKDIALSADQKEIIVTAEGAEPVESMVNVKRRGNSWSTRLSADQPVIYLKAEGDIPLRQEFIVEGPVRREGVEIIAKDPPDFTYSEDVTLDLQYNGNLQIHPANNQSSVEGRSWTLRKLDKNESSRRFLKVIDQEKSYIAAYDMRRASPNDGSVRMNYPFILDARFERWFNGSFGAAAQLDYRILKASNDLSFNALKIEGLYRLSSGIHLQDPSLKVGAYVQRVSLGSEGPMLLGLALIGEAKNGWLLRDLFSWHSFKLYYPFASSGSTYKNKQSMDLEYYLRHFSNSTVYYDVGLRYGAYKFADGEAEVKQGWLTAFVGAGWLF